MQDGGTQAWNQDSTGGSACPALSWLPRSPSLQPLLPPVKPKPWGRALVPSTRPQVYQGSWGKRWPQSVCASHTRPATEQPAPRATQRVAASCGRR